MKLTFFNLGDLTTGRGSEEVLLNLLKYKLNNIEITVVETDFTDKQRISEHELKKSLGNIKLIRIHWNYDSHNIIFHILEYGIPFS